MPSHTGVEPLQFAFDVQVTHLPEGVWQSGVVPVHEVELVAEH